jgi:hypothetical protein
MSIEYIFTASGEDLSFDLSAPGFAWNSDALLEDQTTVLVGGTLKSFGVDYTFDEGEQRIIFTSAPSGNVTIQRITKRDGFYSNFSELGSAPAASTKRRDEQLLNAIEELQLKASGNDGTVTNVTASAPLSVTNGTSTPNISLDTSALPSGVVETVSASAPLSVDSSDPANISIDLDTNNLGVVQSVAASSPLSVDSSDPANPSISIDESSLGVVQTVSASAPLSVDSSDPSNPSISIDTSDFGSGVTALDAQNNPAEVTSIVLGSNVTGSVLNGALTINASAGAGSGAGVDSINFGSGALTGDVVAYLDSMTDSASRGLVELAYTGDYSDLLNTPDIAGQIATALVPYATTADVGTIVNSSITNGGFLVPADLNGYATESYVTSRGYITSSALNGLATESFVTSQGYITSAALSGLATESFVTSQGYLTSVPVEYTIKSLSEGTGIDLINNGNGAFTIAVDESELTGGGGGGGIATINGRTTNQAGTSGDNDFKISMINDWQGTYGNFAHTTGGETQNPSDNTYGLAGADHNGSGSVTAAAGSISANSRPWAWNYSETAKMMVPQHSLLGNTDTEVDAGVTLSIKGELAGDSTGAIRLADGAFFTGGDSSGAPQASVTNETLATNFGDFSLWGSSPNRPENDWHIYAGDDWGGITGYLEYARGTGTKSFAPGPTKSFPDPRLGQRVTDADWKNTWWILPFFDGAEDGPPSTEGGGTRGIPSYGGVSSSMIRAWKHLDRGSDDYALADLPSASSNDKSDLLKEMGMRGNNSSPSGSGTVWNGRYIDQSFDATAPLASPAGGAGNFQPFYMPYSSMGEEPGSGDNNTVGTGSRPGVAFFDYFPGDLTHAFGNNVNRKIWSIVDGATVSPVVVSNPVGSFDYENVLPAGGYVKNLFKEADNWMSDYMETPGDMELNFDRLNYWWNVEAANAGQTNGVDASDQALTAGRDWAQPGAQMMFVPGSDKGGVVQLTCGLGINVRDAVINANTDSTNFPIMVGLFQHTGFDLVDREIDTSKCRLVSAYNIRTQDSPSTTGKTFPVRLMHQWVNTDSKDRIFFVGIWMPGGRKTNGDPNDSVAVQLRREVEAPTGTFFTGWNLRRVDPSLDGDGYRFDSWYSPENHAHWGDITGGSINFANAVDPTASVDSNADDVSMPIFHGLADTYAHANL